MPRKRSQAPEGWPIRAVPWQYPDHDPAKDHQPRIDRHITLWQRTASKWIDDNMRDRRARETARCIVIEAPTFLNDGESLANGEPALSFALAQMADRIGRSVDTTRRSIQAMCRPGGPLMVIWQGAARWPTCYALAMATRSTPRQASGEDQAGRLDAMATPTGTDATDSQQDGTTATRGATGGEGVTGRTQPAGKPGPAQGGPDGAAPTPTPPTREEWRTVARDIRARKGGTITPEQDAIYRAGLEAGYRYGGTA